MEKGAKPSRVATLAGTAAPRQSFRND